MQQRGDPETGRLCCHFCGQTYRSLASHVRAHGHTAESYRADVGLCVGQPLTDGRLSAAIADRQRVRFTASGDLQDGFDRGREKPTQRSETQDLRPSAVARQAAARAAGRVTQQARQRARLAALVAEAGSDDLSELLCARYADGGSLDSLARETGLGRAALRGAMDEAGIEVRGRGRTTDTGRRSRVQLASARAAVHVGTDDLTAWLRTRRAAGSTLAQLGDAVGHSGHWVRWRLEAG